MRDLESNKITGEALSFWLRRSGMKQEALAERIGVEQGTISNMKRGARGIKAEMLERICEAFGVTVPEFFLKDAAELPEIVFVEHVRAKPRAGVGGLETDSGQDSLYAFQRVWLERKGGPGNMKLFHIEGDSMFPTLKAGDMVMINSAEREIRSGFIYLLRHEGDLMIKRLFKKSGGSVLVRSDNSDKNANPDFELEAHDESVDFEIFGRMVWSCREY